MTIEDLKKYYKEVNKCNLCNTYYGIDGKEKDEYKNTCPICVKKIRSEK